MRPDRPRDPVTGPEEGPEPPYPIRMSGPVIKGFGRGSKELGIPTANIPADELSQHPELSVGVYYGVVALDPARFATGETIRPAVLSIGYNPFYKNESKSIEIHIMPPLSAPSPTATTSTDGQVTFHKMPDFYGTPLNLLILGYIRPEYDYVSSEALIEDIRVDCEVARRSLQRPAYRCYLVEDPACEGNVREEIRWLTSFEMDRLRQHLRRRRSSSAGTNPTNSNYGTPLQSPPSANDKHSRRREAEASPPRRLYLTSDTPDFDAGILSRFRAEGFDVEYLPFRGCQNAADGCGDVDKERKELENLLHEREDDLEPGERYAVVAYNKPAHLLLESHHQPLTATNPFPRLCALVAYYPEGPLTSTSTTNNSNFLTSTSPDTSRGTTGSTGSTSSTTTPTTYPPSIPLLCIQIHLAGTSTTTSSIADTLLNSTKNHPRKRHRCHVFTYPESSPRFAEPSSSNYDKLSARLAWSRALETLKRGFGWPATKWRVPDVESVWEEYWRCLSSTSTSAEGGGDRSERDEEDERSHRAAELVGLMVGSGMGVQMESVHSSGSSSSHLYTGAGKGTETETCTIEESPVVVCVPTCAGGTTPSTITKFYTNSNFLSPTPSPSNQSIRLLSRTTGPDRIVDELLLTFRHDRAIPWLLPNLPPTGKDVKVALVLVASFTAGKVARVHAYWDQASVLVQVGVLSRDGLPVVGAEGVDMVVS
ncbi:dienelactone hydrolase [Aspergillus costaricaensis CBS 115574]|uniref:Dienelactone hydrolase n=1 Tax=Aspergillus costaricaensis CBS 115574 TaxID=1448317 RepID=A0ACD1HZG6_9EURO|nr:dienelactone hydrolase [Aspergillus costaricaensis CBS 115574]RAK83406.1 dienelactone hydrolase [Aspergillus costaricaensis CBS 115574]